MNQRSPEDDRQTAQRDTADATPSAQRVFQDAVNRGQEAAAADEFERDSAEYRRQYWNRLAKIDYQIAIAGTPAANDAEFIASGHTILDWLREHQLCDGRSRVLDIGCGVGRIAFHVAPLVRHLHAIDVSDEMVARARANLAHLTNVDVRRTDGESLAIFADGSLDFVYSILVLQHMERANCRRLVAEIARVLGPGGKLLVQLPWSGSKMYTSAYEAEPKDNDLWYARVYSEPEVREMFARNGLVVDVIRVDGDNIWAVATRAARTAPVGGLRAWAARQLERIRGTTRRGRARRAGLS
jgi:SAM-dependent methyltransferase